MMIATTTALYNQEDVIAALNEFIAKYRTRGEAATALGVGRVFLWRVLKGESPPSDTILQHIGFKVERKEVTYVYSKL
jgi:DNA-binding phage protein